MNRNYADPELDALIAELEPDVIESDKSTGGSESATGDDQISQKSAEELFEMAFEQIDNFVTKRHPVLSSTFNDDLQEKFVNRGAPLAIKYAPKFIDNCPDDLKQIWAEIKHEILFAILIGATLMTCVREVRQERRREQMEKEKQAEQTIEAEPDVA